MAFHLFNTDMAHSASDPEITGGSSSSAFIHPRGLTNVGISIPSSGNITTNNINLNSNLNLTGNINFINTNNRIERGNNQLSIFTSGSERLRVENDGNVLFLDSISETAQNAFTTSIGANMNVDVSAGTIFLGSGSTNITGFNFSNVPTSNSRGVTITTMILNSGAYSYPKTCTVNGTNVAGGVRWPNNFQPAATTGTDVLTFSIVRDNASNIRVFGFSATNLA